MRNENLKNLINSFDEKGVDFEVKFVPWYFKYDYFRLTVDIIPIS